MSKTDTKKKYFIPYNSIPDEKLPRIADNIKTIKAKTLKDFVLHDFITYFGNDINKRPISCVIETKSLLNIPNALVVVNFKSHPFIEDLKLVSGFARTTRMDDESLPIPVIYLMPGSTNYQHESIHVCQYLHDESFPLTETQKDTYLNLNLIYGAKYFLETAGEQAMVDFIINVTCYKTWIEFEANYYTKGNRKTWDWMYQAYKSSVPIETFNGIASSMPWNNNYMKEAQIRFADFVNLMEREVRWLKNVAKDCKESCLYDLIMKLHDEYETNQILDSLES